MTSGDTIAEVKSFVKAAEKCFISQPTLSTQIKKLEATLEVKIFERNNKKVFLTEVGELIVNEAKLVLQKTAKIRTIAKNSANPFFGDFKLGAFPTLASYIFPDLVAPIKQELPDVRLILVEEKTEELIKQLKNASLDAAFLALPIADHALEVTNLFYDDFKLAVPANSPLAKKENIDKFDLQNLEILLSEGHCLRGQALQVCDNSGAKEQQDVRATSL